MSATIGGSIEAVEINGRRFAVAADSDASRKLGGVENEVQANGDGTARIVQTRMPWTIDGLTLECNDDRGDQEYLQDIANGKDYVPMSVTFASGSTYQGSGTIVGELAFGSQNATAGVTISGQGTLTKQ